MATYIERRKFLAMLGCVAACRSWAVDDAANPRDDSEPPQIEVVRVKPTDPTSPKLRFQLSDGSVDLMKSRSLGGVDGVGGGWKMPLTDETFDARYGPW
jgi:hypothetical protein